MRIAEIRTVGLEPLRFVLGNGIIHQGRALWISVLSGVLLGCATVCAASNWVTHPLGEGIRIDAPDAGARWPQMAADGTGGAVFAWTAPVSGDPELEGIFAQRLSPSGELLWGDGGKQLLTAPELDISTVHVVASREGSLFALYSRAAWPGNSELRVFRTNASGEAVWGATGALLFQLPLPSDLHVQTTWNGPLLHDGAGGVIAFSWVLETPNTSSGSPTSARLFAHKLDAAGNRAWGENGVLCLQTTGDYGRVRAVSDGAGGALVAVDIGDLHVERIDATGQRLWQRTLSDSQFSITDVELSVSEDSSSYYVGWIDWRDQNGRVYLQRLNSIGTAQWAANGIPVPTVYPANCVDHDLAPAAEGAVVVWADTASPGGYFAQRFNAAGARVWEGENGAIALATRRNESTAEVRVAPDGRGGAFALVGQNLLAQHVSPDGRLLWGRGSIPLLAKSRTSLGLVPSGDRAIAGWSFAGGPEIYANLAPLNLTFPQVAQRKQIRSQGPGWQALTVDYDENHIRSTPFHILDGVVDTEAYPFHWTGIYLYDFGSGRFTTGNYTFRYPL